MIDVELLTKRTEEYKNGTILLSAIVSSMNDNIDLRLQGIADQLKELQLKPEDIEKVMQTFKQCTLENVNQALQISDVFNLNKPISMITSGTILKDCKPGTFGYDIVNDKWMFNTQKGIITL